MLNDIVTKKRQEVEERKQQRPLKSFQALIEKGSYSFSKAIQKASWAQKHPRDNW